MRIVKLLLHNYGSYKGTISIVFDKLNTITGLNLDTNSKNGAGKSLIGEAIIYALFGYLPVSIDKRINKNCNSMRVTLHIELGRDYVVVIRKHSKRPKKTELTILQNNQDISKTTIKQTQEIINQLISPKELFDLFVFKDLYLDIFAQKNKEIISFLIDLFGLNVLSKVKQLINGQKQLLAQNIVITKYKHFPSNKRLNLLKKYKQQYEHLITQLNTEILQYEKSKGSSESNIYNLLRNKEQLERQLQKITKFKVCPLCGSVLTSQYKYLKQDLTNQINVLKSQINQLQKDLENINSSIYPLKTNFNYTQTRLNRINSLIYELETCLSSCQQSDELKQLKVYEKASQVVNDLTKDITLFLLHQVTSTVNYFLSKVSNLIIEINPTYNIRSKPFTIKRQNIPFDFEELSNGEKTLINFAFKLALITFFAIDGVFIVDEGWNFIDNVNFQRLLTLIQSLNYQLILITNKSEFIVGNHIHVTNKNGVSNIKTSI
ncbi:MAG: hypothetical protein ACTSYR_02105 [Candidatus Odinarchaeia archaeon]